MIARFIYLFVFILITQYCYTQNFGKSFDNFKSISQKPDIKDKEEWILYANEDKFLIYGLPQQKSVSELITLYRYSFKSKKNIVYSNVVKGSVQTNKNFLSFLALEQEKYNLHVWSFKQKSSLSVQIPFKKIKDYTVLTWNYDNEKSQRIYALIHDDIEEKNNLQLIDLVLKKTSIFEGIALEYRCFDNGIYVIRSKNGNTYSLFVGDTEDMRKRVLLDKYVEINEFNKYIISNRNNIAFLGREKETSSLTLYFCHNLFVCLTMAENNTLGMPENFVLDATFTPEADPYWYRLFFKIKTGLESLTQSYDSFIFPNAMFKKVNQITDEIVSDLVKPDYSFSNYALGLNFNEMGYSDEAYLFSFINGAKKKISQNLTAQYNITKDGMAEYWIDTKNGIFVFYHNELKRRYEAQIPDFENLNNTSLLSIKIGEPFLFDKKKYKLLLQIDNEWYWIEVPVKKKELASSSLEVLNLIEDEFIDSLELEMSLSENDENILYFKRSSQSGISFYSLDVSSVFDLKTIITFPSFLRTWTYSNRKKRWACITKENGKYSILEGKRDFSKMTKIYVSTN